MSTPFKATGGSHYYTQTGDPCYEVEIKTGKRKGETRKSSLADARKENWLPSITTILGSAYPKMQLDAWIREQAILAVYNNPPGNSGKGDGTHLVKLSEADANQKLYFQHIETLANEKRDKAAARGTELHDGCEAILKGQKWDKKDPQLAALAKWLKANVIEVYFLERSVVNVEIGVAGRLDACVELKDHKRPFILDYKGRGFSHTKSRGWEAKRRKTDLVQLAFYASTQGELPGVANLYIANDRDEPMLDFVEYPDGDRADAFECLRHLVKVWQYENKYRPEIDHEAILAHLEAVA